MNTPRQSPSWCSGQPFYPSHQSGRKPVNRPGGRRARIFSGKNIGGRTTYGSWSLPSLPGFLTFHLLPLLSKKYSCHQIFLPASWYVGSDWTARIAPKQYNPLAFQWQDQPFEIRSILLSEINDGRGLSLLMDIGETMHNGLFKVPIYTYRNFPRREGLTVEHSLASLGRGVTPPWACRSPRP